LLQLPAMSEVDALRERYTERWVLGVCRSPTFVQCLKVFRIAPTITVGTPKGKSITISASDIYGARKRFFSMLETDQEVCLLTQVGDKFVDLYQNWLLNEYTDRYRSITLDAHRKWLRQVIILVVARYLMEQKYTLYIAQGRKAFADAWACSEMCRLQLLNSLTSELARLVHHIMDNQEQQQALIDQFHADLEIRMRGQLFTAPDRLPALPEDVTLPFALLTQKREEELDE
jgi:hypothetical protein